MAGVMEARPRQLWISVKCCGGGHIVMPEIKILLNQDIREVFTLFLYYDIILESSYQVPSVI